MRGLYWTLLGLSLLPGYGFGTVIVHSLYGLRTLGMYSDVMAVLDALVEQETDPEVGKAHWAGISWIIL